MDIEAEAATERVRRPKEPKKMVRHVEALRTLLEVCIDGTIIMPSSTERRMRLQKPTLPGLDKVVYRSRVE